MSSVLVEGSGIQHFYPLKNTQARIFHLSTIDRSSLDESLNASNAVSSENEKKTGST